MNTDMAKHDVSTSQKIGVENKDVVNRMYSWFEEKGLLNKLRAHIRKQMISALKDNSTWNADKINITSPKIQAINLLVADFLMNQENVFTLSVFITEVPLLGNLHEICTYVNGLNNNTQNGPVTKPSFQLNDVQDILEALSILPNSDVMELTCQYYFNDKQTKVNSLLTCLLKAITTIRNNHGKDDKVQDSKNCSKKSTKIESKNRLNSFLVSIEDILTSFNLNEDQKSTLKKLLKRYHQNNNVEEAIFYKERLQQLEKQNMEVAEKVSEVEQMLTAHFHSRETNLLSQKEQIEYVTQQLRLEQQQLHKLINIFEGKEKFMQEKLHQSEAECNKKLQDIENQKYKLHLKEIEILRHEKLLKEESMKHIDETKIVESNKVKLLQEQNTYLAKQLLEVKSKLDKDLQKIESSLGQEMVRKLQRENDELREFTKVQRQRIEELSNKVSSLVKQIEKTHKIPLPSVDYQTKNVKKRLKFVDDCNNKKCGNQNISSTTTTDYSTTVFESDNLTDNTTDEMVREAHSKLKILELKTSKVEQNLKNFKTHYMQRNTDSNINRKSYSENHSHCSDDSDVKALKSSSNKINLKELANKIGYHRTIRRSLNQSLSENDTSPESLRNIRFQDFYISPIKKQSSSVNMSRNSPINRPNSRMESPINKTSYYTGSPKQYNTSPESNTIKRILPDKNCPELNNTEVKNVTDDDIETNNYKIPPHEPNSSKNEFEESKCNDVQNNDVDLQLLNHTQKVDSPQKSTYIREDSTNEKNSSSTSKKEHESDLTISFGSNKTDKSSDFWP